MLRLRSATSTRTRGRMPPDRRRGRRETWSPGGCPADGGYVMTGPRTALAARVDSQRDRLRGGEPPGAVTLVVYGDYECLYSRDGFRTVQRIERLSGALIRLAISC